MAAFTIPINKNTPDSHQTSPCYLLTFLRYASRDTKNFSDADFLALKDPMPVINDCISLNISSNKKSYIHQANMVLMGGDFNYSTALAPGDFVIINMLDNDEMLFGPNGTPETASQSSLYYRCKHKMPINNSDDGFKGIFRIQSVRRSLQTDMASGVKTFVYIVQATAFNEFNQVVYFNPYLSNLNNEVGQDAASAILNANASKEWSKSVDKSALSVGTIFKKLVGFLIGQGFDPNVSPQKDGVVTNYNQVLEIPSEAGALLNLTKNPKNKTLQAADMFNYYVGVEKYDGTNINPINTQSGKFISSVVNPPGCALIQPEPWAQVTAWSILNQYSNSLLNEMYTAFKINPEGYVMPSVVFRQKPFTSELFAKNNAGVPVTKFLELPRWVIDPDLIYSLSLGRDDMARINFVHIVGKCRFVDIADFAAQQGSVNNVVTDNDDILRSGLRPIISACDFDFPTGDNKSTQSKTWANIIFDWMNNGHLKENGTIVVSGISYPIAVGDNLQIDNTVFHIESVNHVMNINQQGMKHFETTIQLSFGVDEGQNPDYNPIYPEMEHSAAEQYRQDDYDFKSQMLPGYSDTQDIAGRTKGEQLTTHEEKPFSTTPKRTPKQKQNITKIKSK